MIQRKQTLFLLIAVVVAIVCLCLPLGDFTTGMPGEASTMYNLWIVRPDGTYDWSIWALFAILLITCPIALVAIFSYHNRKAQSRFCMFNILLSLGWYVVFAVTAFGLKGSMGNFDVSFNAILPAVSMILYFMARKAILADEALVRSADRIR